jgi:hypothetical protein
MEGGPFPIDSDYESVLRSADWQRIGVVFDDFLAR